MRAPLDESELVLRDCEAEDHQSVKHRVALALMLSSRPFVACARPASQKRALNTKRLTRPREPLHPTLHRLHRVGENTAILGCARRLAYATKTLCDNGSTVKV